MRLPALSTLATATLYALLAGGTLSAQTAPRPAAGATPPPAPTLAARLGYPADAKLLILHGDDLGVAHAVDTASLDALERGVLSSASVMMPTPWVTEVAAWARAHPDHDLGLHLTLTSEWESYRWGPLAPAAAVPTLLDSTGTLARDTPPVSQHAAPDQVERELRAQVERALALGLRPTHLDSHMGALFTTPALFATLVRVARAYHLPFLTARGVARSLPPDVHPDRDVVLDTVVTADAELPPERWKAFYLDAIRNLKPGLTEMIVHLGRDDAELQAITVHHPSWGAAWRQRDDDVLRSPEFRQALKDNGVVLVRWKDLQRAVAGAS
ncbi:carbohydrate deacetylase [Gemmatimonadetes bacterium T265]|nr:carbohydrate deacetylase [Gemmatimonadetes bacterium T265]